MENILHCNNLSNNKDNQVVMVYSFQKAAGSEKYAFALNTKKEIMMSK
jgi:hypothetical protein